jgi:hypothetical protein
MQWARWRNGLYAACAAGVVACNLVLGIDERPPKPNAVVHAATTGTGGGPPGTTLYVSTQGDDESDGLSPETPKKTIAAALHAARLDPAIEGIQVCGGSYAEDELLLDVPVSLRGGFDCASWMRSDDHGWPSFDPTHETVVEPADDRGAVLRVEGSKVDRTVLIDGFTWRACPVKQSSLDAFSLDDFTGAPRTAPPSIGAHEQDDPMGCP